MIEISEEHRAKIKERLRTDGVFVQFLSLKNGMSEEQIIQRAALDMPEPAAPEPAEPEPAEPEPAAPVEPATDA